MLPAAMRKIQRSTLPVSTKSGTVYRQIPENATTMMAGVERKPAETAVSPKTNANGPEAEAIAALVSLGYTSSEAARAVSQVAGKATSPDEMIFLALKSLGS